MYLQAGIMFDDKKKIILKTDKNVYQNCVINSKNVDLFYNVNLRRHWKILTVVNLDNQECLLMIFNE